jgi:zinc protease
MRRELWPGPHTIASTTLANGLRVWVYENHTAETVAIEGTLVGGAVHEPPAQAGLAHLTSRMLRRGTRRRSFDALNETLDGLGATLGFRCGRHALGFDAYCLAEDFATVLALATESLLEPAFEAGQFALVHAQILADLDQRQHSTAFRASATFRRLLFGRHPYGRPLIGEKETVSPLTCADAEGFYRRTIGPQKGLLVIVGAVRAERAMAAVEGLLGAWNPAVLVAEPEFPPPTLPPAPQVETVTLAGKSQSDILLGWPGLPRRHPDYIPARVANAILGQFGLGGRLGANVRERQGLAYSIGSSLDANEQAGTWSVAAGVHPAVLARTIAAIRDECERMRQDPVTPEELADVQSHLTGSLLLSLETNAGMTDYLSTMAWYDLGMDYLLRYHELIHAVTRDDVLRVAQTYLDPDRYVLAVAGPPTDRPSDEGPRT